MFLYHIYYKFKFCILKDIFLHKNQYINARILIILYIIHYMALDRILRGIFYYKMNASIYINMAQYIFYTFIHIIKGNRNEDILLGIQFYREDNHFYTNLYIRDCIYYFVRISLNNLHEIAILNILHISSGNYVHIQVLLYIFLNNNYFLNTYLLVNHNLFPINDHIQVIFFIFFVYTG